MISVTLNGWRPGLNKVQLTRILQASAGLSLGDAKRLTDDVVDGKSVMVTLVSEKTAGQFLEGAGTLCRLVQ